MPELAAAVVLEAGALSGGVGQVLQIAPGVIAELRCAGGVVDRDLLPLDVILSLAFGAAGWFSPENRPIIEDMPDDAEYEQIETQDCKAYFAGIHHKRTERMDINNARDYIEARYSP